MKIWLKILNLFVVKGVIYDGYVRYQTNKVKNSKKYRLMFFVLDGILADL
jgi:hypothetical protein